MLQKYNMKTVIVKSKFRGLLVFNYSITIIYGTNSDRLTKWPSNLSQRRTLRVGYNRETQRSRRLFGAVQVRARTVRGPRTAHEANDFFVSGLNLFNSREQSETLGLSKILSSSGNCGQFVMESWHRRLWLFRLQSPSLCCIIFVLLLNLSKVLNAETNTFSKTSCTENILLNEGSVISFSKYKRIFW